MSKLSIDKSFFPAEINGTEVLPMTNELPQNVTPAACPKAICSFASRYNALAGSGLQDE